MEEFSVSRMLLLEMSSSFSIGIGPRMIEGLLLLVSSLLGGGFSL